VLDLLTAAIGCDVAVSEYSARTVPPDREGGYTEWHRDYGRHNNGARQSSPFPSEIVRLLIPR
jgi:hypothetical protein